MPFSQIISASQEASCNLYSRKETAKRLGVSPKTLAQWPTTRPGYLPFCRIGNRVKYHIDDINRLMDRRHG